MKSFAQYEQRKKTLLEAYDAILASDLLPVEETGTDQVRDRRKDLEDGRFLVAVCGRIKAGKSTLLNALLFRDWVVPTDDLPLTAKNTLIEYGATPSLEVTFFCRSEWTMLTGELRAGDPKVAAEFFGEVREAAARGVAESTCVLAEGLVRRSANVADLAQFVTPVSKGGIYTPFVKQVRLAHPHPWLRSVTIADTPGVDDPYKFREDQTKKFVTRAGAVLYVTYAGQAMAQQDFDFLNEYLIHVGPQRRLIAVNKADTLKQGSDDVEAYLRSLMNSPEPAIRNVFGKRDAVHMVSALGALIAEALQQARPLSEDNQYYRSQLERSGHLAAEKNGIDGLRESVEERLVSQDGESILRDHVEFLTSLFERKRRLSQRNIALREEHLHDLGRTEDQLRAQIGEIRHQLDMMTTALDKGAKQVKACRKVLLSSLEDAFDTTTHATVGHVRKELDEHRNIDNLGERAAWSFNEQFRIQRERLKAALASCVNGIETSLKDFGDELRGAWAGWRSAAYLEDALSYSLYDTLHSLHGVRDSVGSAAGLEKVLEDSTAFYQRWFNTQSGRRTAASAIVQKLNADLKKAMDDEFDRVQKELTQEIDQRLKTMGEQLSEVQRTRLSDLEKLTQGSADRIREREAVLAEIAAANADLVRLGQVQVSIQEALAR